MNTKFETVVLSDVSPMGNEFTFEVKYFADCEICDKAKAEGRMPFINHDSCVYFDYPQNAVGHKQTRGHCTADSCC